MAATPTIYTIGSKARLVAEFFGDDGAPADPDTPIVFKIREPDGTVIERTYLSDPVVRTGAGVYRYDYSLRAATPGKYSYRVESAEPDEAAEEKIFRVRSSVFYP